MESSNYSYQQRVREERDALSTLSGKLWVFMGTPTFRALPEAERARLQMQHRVMSLYGSILQDRIGAFDGA